MVLGATQEVRFGGNSIFENSNDLRWIAFNKQVGLLVDLPEHFSAYSCELGTCFCKQGAGNILLDDKSSIDGSSLDFFKKNYFGCLPCEPGSYSASASFEQCEMCPSGRYGPRRGLVVPGL